MIRRFLISLVIILISVPVFSQGLVPGDQLKIVVKGVQEFQNISFEVQANGTLSLPFIGEVQVQGFSMDQLNEVLKEKYSNVFKNPEIISIIIMKAPLNIGVMAFGDNGSKLLSLPQGSTIVEVIAGSEIDLRKAALNRIKIIKKDGTVLKVNVSKMLKGGDKETLREYILGTGDVVIIPKKFFYIDLQTTLQFLSLVSSVIVILKYFEVG